ncbi:MAG: hypothetical protein HQL09_09750 [Nitrospirae bacterium]|nr:hypothetical protein [Nitrospirota bacterium]
MYYKYVSLAAETGLPSGQGWTHDNGGQLTTTVQDTLGNPQGQPVVTTPQPPGVYDPPGTSYSGNAVDPDAGLKQLISQVVVPGIQGNGAAFAIVDYVRQIVPVYDCDNTGVCTARRSVDFQSRTLSLTDPCNPGGAGTYECSGVWGFELQYTTFRYIVDPQGNYSLTSQLQTATPSPAVQFDVSAPVSGVAAASLQYVVVDPHGTGQMYDIRNDTVNNLPCASYIDQGVSCNAAPISQSQQQCVPQQGDGGGGG